MPDEQEEVTAAIERLKGLLEKATPGPWTLECGDHSHRYVCVTGENEQTVHYKYGSGTKASADQDEANAALIVAAVNALPKLLSIIARSEGAGTDWRPIVTAPTTGARIVATNPLWPEDRRVRVVWWVEHGPGRDDGQYWQDDADSEPEGRGCCLLAVRQPAPHPDLLTGATSEAERAGAPQRRAYVGAVASVADCQEARRERNCARRCAKVWHGTRNVWRRVRFAQDAGVGVSHIVSAVSGKSRSL